MNFLEKSLVIIGVMGTLGGCHKSTEPKQSLLFPTWEKAENLRVATINQTNALLGLNKIELFSDEQCVITMVDRRMVVACSGEEILNIEHERVKWDVMQVLNVSVNTENRLDNTSGCLSLEKDGDGKEFGPDCPMEVDTLPNLPPGKKKNT